MLFLTDKNGDFLFLDENFVFMLVGRILMRCKWEKKFLFCFFLCETLLKIQQDNMNITRV